MEYQTDKQAGGLLGHYEQMFGHLRDTEIEYWEIGILKGESLRWAKDFFKKGTIIGIDILIPEIDFTGVRMIECSQDNIQGMDEIGRDCGFFDIIIDDASHIKELTEQTFDVFWKYLKSGGWYIIEDWTAGYTDIPKYKGMAEVITNILLNQKKYKFGDVKINSDIKSFAAFRK